MDPLVSPFPSPFGLNGEYGTGVAAVPKSAVELQMMAISAAIRKKKEWYNKRLNADIRDKWYKECQQQTTTASHTQPASPDQLPPPPALSAAAWEYIVDELSYYDSLRHTSDGTGIEPSVIDAVWQSDVLIDAALNQALVTEMNAITSAIPIDQLDWHPGSNNQVLDIVHPSLYCLVAERSLITQSDIVLAETMDRLGEGKSISLKEFKRSYKELIVQPPFIEQQAANDNDDDEEETDAGKEQDAVKDSVDDEGVGQDAEGEDDDGDAAANDEGEEDEQEMQDLVLPVDDDEDPREARAAGKIHLQIHPHHTNRLHRKRFKVWIQPSATIQELLSLLTSPVYLPGKLMNELVWKLWTQRNNYLKADNKTLWHYNLRAGGGERLYAQTVEKENKIQAEGREEDDDENEEDDEEDDENDKKKQAENAIPVQLNIVIFEGAEKDNDSKASSTSIATANLGTPSSSSSSSLPTPSASLVLSIPLKATLRTLKDRLAPLITDKMRDIKANTDIHIIPAQLTLKLIPSVAASCSPSTSAGSAVCRSLDNHYLTAVLSGVGIKAGSCLHVGVLPIPRPVDLKGFFGNDWIHMFVPPSSSIREWKALLCTGQYGKNKSKGLLKQLQPDDLTVWSNGKQLRDEQNLAWYGLDQGQHGRIEFDTRLGALVNLRQEEKKNRNKKKEEVEKEDNGDGNDDEDDEDEDDDKDNNKRDQKDAEHETQEDRRPEVGDGDGDGDDALDEEEEVDQKDEDEDEDEEQTVAAQPPADFYEVQVVCPPYANVAHGDDETDTGNYVFDVTAQMTIAQLKAAYQRVVGYDPRQQQLYTTAQTAASALAAISLDDQHTMAHYGIVADTTLYIVLHCGYKLELLISRAESHQRVDMVSLRTDTLLQLKERLYQLHADLPANRQIWRVLNENLQEQHCNLNDLATIQEMKWNKSTRKNAVVVYMAEQAHIQNDERDIHAIPITIKAANNDIYPLSVRLDEPIECVKMRVMRTLHGRYCIRLYHHEVELKNKHTVGQCGITANSIVQMIKPSIAIRILPQNVCVHCQPADTMLQVKQMIEAQTQIPVALQHLRIQQRFANVNDDQTVKQHHLRIYQPVELVRRQTERTQREKQQPGAAAADDNQDMDEEIIRIRLKVRNDLSVYYPVHFHISESIGSIYDYAFYALQKELKVYAKTVSMRVRDCIHGNQILLICIDKVTGSQQALEQKGETINRRLHQDTVIIVDLLREEQEENKQAGDADADADADDETTVESKGDDEEAEAPADYDEDRLRIAPLDAPPTITALPASSSAAAKVVDAPIKEEDVENDDHVEDSHQHDDDEYQNQTASNKYAWLPAEFQVHEDGHVTIESYINNLHPIRHRSLYTVLEQLCARFIPLWNHVLTDLRHPRPNRVDVDNWYVDDTEAESEDDEDDYDEFAKKKLVHPEPEPFTAPAAPRTVVNLKGRRLQIIVKLADIILTPDNPSYPGGVWHVEGMKNECIVASGIYYYAQENISESQLAFRTAITEPEYEQNDDRGVAAVYGLMNDDALVQPMGSLITSVHRCIAFPNIYQHRVSPFHLIDKNRPGYRKILVFFLVDPTQRILSTARISPQQQDWSEQLFHSVLTDASGADVISDMVSQLVDRPMSLEEAKHHRARLMKERKYFIAQNTEAIFERPFSLCEH